MLFEVVLTVGNFSRDNEGIGEIGGEKVSVCQSRRSSWVVNGWSILFSAHPYPIYYWSGWMCVFKGEKRKVKQNVHTWIILSFILLLFCVRPFDSILGTSRSAVGRCLCERKIREKMTLVAYNVAFHLVNTLLNEWMRTDWKARRFDFWIDTKATHLFFFWCIHRRELFAIMNHEEKNHMHRNTSMHYE